MNLLEIVNRNGWIVYDDNYELIFFIKPQDNKQEGYYCMSVRMPLYYVIDPTLPMPPTPMPLPPPPPITIDPPVNICPDVMCLMYCKRKWFRKRSK